MHDKRRCGSVLGGVPEERVHIAMVDHVTANEIVGVVLFCYRLVAPRQFEPPDSWTEQSHVSALVVLRGDVGTNTTLGAVEHLIATFGKRFL